MKQMHFHSDEVLIAFGIETIVDFFRAGRKCV